MDKVKEFAAVWSDSMLATDLGGKITCRETDALARLLVAAGDPIGALTWIVAHGQEEDSDDDHYGVTTDQAGLEYMAARL